MPGIVALVTAVTWRESLGTFVSQQLSPGPACPRHPCLWIQVVGGVRSGRWGAARPGLLGPAGPPAPRLCLTMTPSCRRGPPRPSSLLAASTPRPALRPSPAARQGPASPPGGPLPAVPRPISHSGSVPGFRVPLVGRCFSCSGSDALWGGPSLSLQGRVSHPPASSAGSRVDSGKRCRGLGGAPRPGSEPCFLRNLTGLSPDVERMGELVRKGICWRGRSPLPAPCLLF